MPISIDDWIERDRPNLSPRAVATLEALRSLGTLDAVARVGPWALYRIGGTGRRTVEAVEASLKRAGLKPCWSGPRPRDVAPADYAPPADAAGLTIDQWIDVDQRYMTGRALNAFYRLDSHLGHGLECKTVGDVAALSRRQLLSVTNLGKRAMEDLQPSLARAGLQTTWDTSLCPHCGRPLRGILGEGD